MGLKIVRSQQQQQKKTSPELHSCRRQQASQSFFLFFQNQMHIVLGSLIFSGLGSAPLGNVFFSPFH